MAGSGRDERAWIRGAQSGSVPDLEALFRHHWPRAYRAAYLVVHDSGAAEDIAQEAFLAALRSLERFDRRRPFGPWLHRIVVNRAIDWSRARALRARGGREVERSRAASDPRPDGDRRDLAAALARALARAPRGDRAAPPARVHARGDREDARPAARHRQLAPSSRARRACAESSEEELR